MNWKDNLAALGEQGVLGPAELRMWNEVLEMAAAAGADIKVDEWKQTYESSRPASITVYFVGGTSHSADLRAGPDEFLKRVAGGHRESVADSKRAGFAKDALSTNGDARTEEPMKDGVDILD